MAAFVARNDFESRSDRESDSRDKRIPKANAVDVLGARSHDDFAARFVVGKESIDNRQLHLRPRPDLGRSRNTPAVWRRLDKAAEEPPPKPSGCDLLDRKIRFFFKRSGNRWHVGFVRDAQVLETLPQAPGARYRLPIELFNVESSNQRLCGLVVSA